RTRGGRPEPRRRPRARPNATTLVGGRRACRPARGTQLRASGDATEEASWPPGSVPCAPGEQPVGLIDRVHSLDGPEDRVEMARVREVEVEAAVGHAVP